MSATHCGICGMEWKYHGTACVAGGQEPKRSLAPATGSGTVRHNGYYIEVAPGGPWLTRGYGVTTRFEDRGIWQTLHDSQEAVEKSLSPNTESSNPPRVC